jgi:glycosyltransferase involved in cell wall biosynthesis
MKNASVVIASHNNSKVLKKVLEGMEQLEFDGKYEVIVVDDGSRDGTKEMVKPFLKNKTIRFFGFEKNAGVCKARNKGIELAKYDIVVNMDHDCIPKRDWLKKIVAGFNRDKVGVVSSYGGYGGTSTAFRKELLKKVRGYDEDYGYYREDTDLTFKIMELGFEFSLVKADFVHDHKEVAPKGIIGLLRYVLKRLKYHMNDVLLYKKHPTKICKEFLYIKFGFLIDPYKDFSVATGLWNGKFNLSSPRGIIFIEANSFAKKIIIVLCGVAWVLLVKAARLVGSIKYKKLLI